METKRNGMWNIALIYGSLLAVSNLIVSITYYILNMSEAESQRYIGYILMLVFLVLGILQFRNKDLNGYISYGKALGTGTLISLIGGIIIAVYFYIFTQFIDTEFIGNMMEKTRIALENEGMPEEQIERMIQGQQMMMNSPIIMFFTMIAANVLLGFVFSLIVSIFLRKEDPSFENKFGTE